VPPPLEVHLAISNKSADLQTATNLRLDERHSTVYHAQKNELHAQLGAMHETIRAIKLRDRCPMLSLL
jgi:hypothetical protein